MCNNELCLLFDSKHGTPCSPMRNVETSILLQWSTILLSLELNASSERESFRWGLHLHAFVDFGRKYRTRNTRAFDVEGCHPNVSPSRGTPEEDMIMQSKMETLLLGDSNDLLEADWLQMVMCGLKSSMQRMSQNFGRYANHWLHVHWSLNSHNSELSPPGSSHQSESRMKLRRELSSTRLGWLNSIAGYETTLSQVKQEVSYLARRPDLAAPTRGAFGGTSPRGTPPPSARGLECAGNATEG